MTKLAETILQYLGKWYATQHTYACIELDLHGRVVSWKGDVKKLGIAPLCKGLAVTEQLIFAEGLWPPCEAKTYLPMIKAGDSHPLDVHLLQVNDGYVFLLIDVYENIRQLTDYQQKINDFTLWKEKQVTEASSAIPKLTFNSIDNFFKACNTAALQLGSDGKFRLIDQAPDWLHRLCPGLAEQPCDLKPENFFSFLNNFLIEAHAFWSRKVIGNIRSGIWIEENESGQEHLFEATAVFTGQREILLISNETSLIDERQTLIQKARELALGHNHLEKIKTKLQFDHEHLKARFNARNQDVEQANERLEEELLQRHQLEQERTQILLQLQQAQKMEAIGTLAGGIAHDFNNILSAVVGFTELSLFEAPKESALASNLRQVLSAAQRAKELIRQILTFSRQSNPETRPIQLSLIIKEALRLLRASLPATVEIKQNIQSESYVLADPTQLHQVVMNLSTNAGQAMVADGGVLEIDLHDKKIKPNEKTYYQNIVFGTYIEMHIKDNGTGMTKETLARIFDPFFTTKKKGQGTGMGLSVVHGIVKNCKGEISVTSQIGKGTTFRIIFPIVNPVELPEIVTPSDFPKGTEKILFVDDEPTQTDLALKTLSPLGYNVTAMTDSAEALKLFINAPYRFDIVITDMYMPKITGKHLAIEILKIRPEMPIILCSGYSIDLIAPTSMDKYFKGHLMKPFLIKEMAETIRKVLKQPKS